MFSQNREEEAILKAFESPAGNTKIGTLLSIGENDGVTLSNSRALILKGWEADLVEPDPAALEKLKALYSSGIHDATSFEREVKIFPVAVGVRNEKTDFYSTGTHLNKGDTGLLSTLIADELKRFPGSKDNAKIVPVTVVNFETLLLMTGRKYYDFVSIDAEGMDLDILKQIDFTALQTKCICVEWNSKDRHLYDRVVYRFGFILSYISAENLVYVK